MLPCVRYEARTDHLKKTEHPLLLREDHRLAIIFTSTTRASADEGESHSHKKPPNSFRLRKASGKSPSASSKIGSIQAFQSLSVFLHFS